MEKKLFELTKLKEAINRMPEKRLLRPLALKKVLAYLQGKEKPTKKTLDRLSLFVGFQDWESFKEAVHGDGEEGCAPESGVYPDIRERCDALYPSVADRYECTGRCASGFGIHIPYLRHAGGAIL